MGCVRRAVAGRGLAGEIVAAGRAALVEDEGGRRLRGGGGGHEAKARLEAAMRKAEADRRRAPARRGLYNPVPVTAGRARRTPG